jgi:hypothetical protein
MKVKLAWHHFGGKINWFQQKKKGAKKESSCFEEPRCNVGSNSRID